MAIIVNTYDVFAVAPFQGNQAAVLFDRQGDVEYQLLALAREFLLPETVLRTRHNNIPVFQFATANGLIERCGHGTLAGIADAVLESSAIVGQETAGQYGVGNSCATWKAQIISENCVDISVIWPERPYAQGTLSANDIAAALGLSLNDLHSDLPKGIYNSGNRNALVPINNISALEKAQPDWELLKELCKKQELTDIHLYYLNKDKSSDSEFWLSCRNIFPYGVREETATGTASVSLAAALVDAAMVRKEGELVFYFEQGVGARRGYIKVLWSRKDSEKPVIWLEGRTYRIMSGTLLFNPLDEHELKASAARRCHAT